MKILDPKELRAVVDLPLGDYLDQEKEGFDLRGFFKKSLRHKKIIFLTFSIVFPLSILNFWQSGTKYEKIGFFAVNNSTNNSFFKYLDQSIVGESSRSREDLEAYATKAITNLTSEPFIDFCYEKAVNDPGIAKIFGLNLKKTDSSDLRQDSKIKISQFFDETMKVIPLEKKINRPNPVAGFSVRATHKEMSFLEASPEKISKVINEYLAYMDVRDSDSARQLIKNKTEEIQKKILENSDKKFKISQTIPLVEKSSLYGLQAQLQATQITISGNKAIEDQFKESLANVEKKIGEIGEESNRSDVNDLNRELSSLTTQKNEFQSQGLEKESFLYRNIAAKLNKTLKELEESQKNINNSQKSDESQFYSAKLLELNKYLDEMSFFADRRIDQKFLSSNLEKSTNVNFPENLSQDNSAPTPRIIVSRERVDELASQLDSLKKVIQGNSFFESRLTNKISSLEKKLNLLKVSASIANQGDISGYIQDISNMAYLKNQLRLQGVDEDSVITKRITENLKKATRELQEKKNISLKNINIGDVYSPPIDEVSIYTQKAQLEKIKGENSFYQAKVLELNKAIEELGFLLNDKAIKENQISEIDESIKIDRSSLQSLNDSLLKIELNDIKANKRFEVSFSPIEKKTLIPPNAFYLVSFLLCFLIGFVAAYFKETNYPSFKNIDSFKDRGLNVIAGLPSTQNNLFQENVFVDGITNASYLRAGISLENILSPISGKVVLITSSHICLKSATIALNLGAFFGSTGKKVLLLETDIINNSVAKITGAPLNGGVSDLYLRKDKIDFFPFKVCEGLDVLAGDPLLIPPIYRLASPNFKSFLDELSLHYDYVFLHVRPCLDASEAFDLSRYADLGVVCCDVETMNVEILNKLNNEMSHFMSKETGFILENLENIDSVSFVKPTSQKIAA